MIFIQSHLSKQGPQADTKYVIGNNKQLMVCDQFMFIFITVCELLVALLLEVWNKQ